MPLTYLFVLQFPLSMKIMTERRVPVRRGRFGAHRQHHRAQARDRCRRAADHHHARGELREHRKGLLIDMISEFTVGSEVVAVQTATFLKQQRQPVRRTARSRRELGPAAAGRRAVGGPRTHP